MAVPLLFHRFRTGLTPETIAITLATGLFFFLLLCPLIGLSFDLIQAFITGSADIASPLFLSPRRMGLLAASVGFAAAVAGAGIVIGVLFISSLFRLPGKLFYGILLLLLALAGIPPYIHALTWSEALQVAGTIIPGIPTTGWTISFWVELMALLPLSAFLSWIAFASVDIRLVDAGRLVRSDLVGPPAHHPAACRPGTGSSVRLCLPHLLHGLFGAVAVRCRCVRTRYLCPVQCFQQRCAGIPVCPAAPAGHAPCHDRVQVGNPHACPDPGLDRGPVRQPAGIPGLVPYAAGRCRHSRGYPDPCPLLRTHPCSREPG